MSFTVALYDPQEHSEWDAFVGLSRNAALLHRRDYMEYHADRFPDFSLVARDAHGRMAALLPATRSGSTVSSHAGLTFGGWLLPPERTDTVAMLEIWDEASRFMASQDVTELIYKPVPHIYHRYPAEEDLYALFRAGATLTARLVSSAIDLTRPLGFRERGRRNLAAAQRAGVTVAESDRWPDYWAILTALLHDRYGVAPVHTLDEITRLHSLLSGHISLWAAFGPDGVMLAGTVIYKSPEVWHAQYIAASPAGKECGALAAVFRAVHDAAAAAGVRWFDFGTSCERGGHYLNAGLAGQKASFGARAVVYDTYRVAIGV